MRERPILFSTEMVKAILDGRKICTRRLVKFLLGKNPQWTGYIKDGLMLYNGKNEPCIIKAPYQSGDILYVRETRQEAGSVYDFDYVIVDTEKYYYAAGSEASCFDFWVDPETGEHKDPMPWRRSIHMPKDAARIWLKVTNVRVERLQEITEAEAILEGAIDNRAFIHSSNNEYDHIHTAREHFIDIWNSTIKESDRAVYGWDANPYVWAIEFERCQGRSSNGR